MRIARKAALVLQTIIFTVLAMTVPIVAAHATSVYDDLLQTTSTLELQTSALSCSGSSPVDHTSDWFSAVGGALRDFNLAHSNSIAEWGDDWSARVGTAIIAVETADSQKYFRVLYSTSGGENSFYASGGTEYFSVSDPAPVTPFRSITIATEGDGGSSCSQVPMVVGASTGGLSMSVGSFDNGYSLFMSNFPTDEPFGYEGESVPAGPSFPSLYWGTVDCIDPAKQPVYVFIRQAGNDGKATLTYSSPGRADWRYNFIDTPYQVTVGCGDTLAASFGSVSPLPPNSRDWVCNVYDIPAGCVLA